MVKRTLNRSITAALLFLGGICPFGAFGAEEPVTGVIGLTPVLEHTCLAAYVPLPEGKALAGVEWYNNDGTATFPRVLVTPGGGSGPGLLTAATVEAANVAGFSSGVSELTFGEPIISVTGGVYVIFEYPANQEQVGLGEGGGPGVGYRSGTVGTAGWVSADGMAWHRLHPSFRLALVPTLVDAEVGMKALRTVKEPVVAATVLQTMLRPASPNPFNPKTKLEFTLGRAGTVSLAVYNLRGELVARLVDEAYAAGAHTVEWAGLDTRGRACPSGIYFAQMKAAGVVMTQRLALLR